MAAAGLNTAIWNNNLRSLLLLVLYPLTIMGLVWAVAMLYGTAITYNGTLPSWDRVAPVGNAVLLAWWPSIASVIACWFTVAYFFHGNMIRMLSHARTVSRAEEPALYNQLENLCISRGLKTPALQIIETDALNAFASGINEQSYSITVTRGLIKTLAPDEMEAVLGHELTHIINRDVRLLIISVIFTGMIGFAAQMVWSGIRRSVFYRRRNEKSDIRIILIIAAIGIILWLGYCATLFTRFALSRRREYMADAGSVALTKNPEAMMRALQRIAGHDHIPGAPADVSLMCIENAHSFMGLFSTHPPISDRIDTLSTLTHTPVPALPAVHNAPHNPWA